MARHAGRSRGCKSCLHRRIKCDEKTPECTQCISRGQKCPGATVGAVFVPMKPKMKKKAGPKGSGDSRSQKDPSVFSEDSKSDCTNGSSDISHTAPCSSKLVAGSAFGEYLFPATYQPSKTAPFEQLFLGRFISAFDNRNLQRTPLGSWYDHLPAIYNASPYQSCRESTRAAMMVHYGVMTSDVSIQTEACRWYAKALESQRSFLRRDKLGHTKTMPAAEEILSPIILALFELVSCTTPTGWIDHVTGAATMLEMRRPENCQTGLAHLVFRTIRPAIVYMTMATEEQHKFALPPWTILPFQVHPKTSYDKLLDILLLIPGCLSLRNKIDLVSDLDAFKCQKLRSKLELSASLLIIRLQDWWQEYAQEHARTGRDANLFGGQKPFSTSSEPYFPDAFTAACTASYHASVITIYALFTFCSSEANVYDSQIAWHSGQILGSCAYLMANLPSSAMTVMMVFPLKTICRSSRNELQRQEAYEILEMWGQKKGIQGICTQAAPFYNIPVITTSTVGSQISQYIHE